MTQRKRQVLEGEVGLNAPNSGFCEVSVGLNVQNNKKDKS